MHDHCKDEDTQDDCENALFMSEQECVQDILRRLHGWLDQLEVRVTALLTCGGLEEMKPGEREQAISRHLSLMLRLLQLRQQYAKAFAAAREQATLEDLLQPGDAYRR